MDLETAKYIPNLPNIALPSQHVKIAIASRSNCLKTIFSLGFSDYVTYPIVLDEIRCRIAIWMFIGNDYKKIVPGGHYESNKNENNRMVEEACHLMHKNPERRFNLNGLAKSVGTNRSKLTYAFIDVTGAPPFKWLRQHRLALARKMLVTSDKDIQSISDCVGYKYIANFSSAFKKEYLLSPAKYRKNYAKENNSY
ncbi:helix-turn-helix domain-containing protein [Teredinibacter franksiae]|uniref:helix-turn-helix domain-containing protein n=1 Tax=Teredinibacter franksiae TaxID=2761453 RepID=UPI0016299C48|nr:AraC family transcriptional regulator [Teredinibacter franksiae]